VVAVKWGRDRVDLGSEQELHDGYVRAKRRNARRSLHGGEFE